VNTRDGIEHTILAKEQRVARILIDRIEHGGMQNTGLAP
jgi:hypothetical protein